MRKIFWNSIKKSLYGFLTIIGLWFILSLFFDEVLVPSPVKLIINIPEIWSGNDVWYHYGLTMYRLLVGFIISFLSGTFIGIFSYYVRINNYVENVMTFLQVVPGVIIGTILILLSGSGDGVPIGMIIVMITPMVATNTVNGLLDRPKELVEVINVFGGGMRDIITHVYVPKLIPIFKMNLLVCTALSLKIIILGEFIGCDNGIGFLFNNAKLFFNMSEVYSYLLLIIVTALSFQVLIQGLFVIVWRKFS